MGLWLNPWLALGLWLRLNQFPQIILGEIQLLANSLHHVSGWMKCVIENIAESAFLAEDFLHVLYRQASLVHFKFDGVNQARWSRPIMLLLISLHQRDQHLRPFVFGRTGFSHEQGVKLFQCGIEFRLCL